MRYCLFFYIILLIFFTSCKDECKEAGTGGNITIVAYPKHHDANIISEGLPGYPDSAWIKFNTRDFPGTDPSDYDLILVADSGEDHVHIEGLKCGDYFIYMTGWHTDTNERVTGGIPYSIPENGPAEIILNIPVTE